MDEVETRFICNNCGNNFQWDCIIEENKIIEDRVCPLCKSKDYKEKMQNKVTVEMRTEFFDTEGWYAPDLYILKWFKENKQD